MRVNIGIVTVEIPGILCNAFQQTALGGVKPLLRLYFLDRYGAIVGSSDVSYTSAAGRTATQAANDGRVVVSWSQVNDDGTSEIKVVRLPCVGG